MVLEVNKAVSGHDVMVTLRIRSVVGWAVGSVRNREDWRRLYRAARESLNAALNSSVRTSYACWR